MPNKRRNISETRRREILVASAQLFANSGYHGVSVDEIARKAGISKGNLYWHFKSKKEIFHKLFDYIAGSLFVPINEIITSDIPAREKLIGITQNCLDTAEANPDVVRFGWQIIAQPNLREMLNSQYSEWLEPFIDQLIPLFEEIGDTNPKEVARFYALTLDAFMGLRVMMPEMIRKDTIVEIIEERLIGYKKGE